MTRKRRKKNKGMKKAVCGAKVNWVVGRFSAESCIVHVGLSPLTWISRVSDEGWGSRDSKLWHRQVSMDGDAMEGREGMGAGFDLGILARVARSSPVTSIPIPFFKSQPSTARYSHSVQRRCMQLQYAYAWSQEEHRGEPLFDDVVTGHPVGRIRWHRLWESVKIRLELNFVESQRHRHIHLTSRNLQHGGYSGWHGE